MIVRKRLLYEILQVLVVFLNLTVSVCCSSLWAYVHVAVFNICLVLALWAHGKASFGDPGVVPLPKTHIDFSTVLQQQSNVSFLLPSLFPSHQISETISR